MKMKHDTDHTFRPCVRGLDLLPKRSCQGQPPLTGVQGCSPGSSLLSSAACGGGAKEEKGVFRGHPEPRQRADRPLQSRLSGGSRSFELLFRKFDLCHAVVLPQAACKRRKKVLWGHPTPRQGRCAPCILAISSPPGSEQKRVTR